MIKASKVFKMKELLPNPKKIHKMHILSRTEKEILCFQMKKSEK